MDTNLTQRNDDSTTKLPKYIKKEPLYKEIQFQETLNYVLN